jgi:succinoglycan biosynthesis transport protein ExoP
VDELRGKLTTVAIPSTLLISITASDPAPDQAALIANTVAKEFRNYIALQSTAAKVDIVLAVPAQSPSAPYAPRTPLYLALGGILGLLAASGGIALLEILDGSIKSAGEALTSVGRPILGALPYDRKLRRNPQTYLPFLMAPDSPYAEAVRQLRTRVFHPNLAQSSVCIALTSSRAGEGKSAVSVNLAAALALSGFIVTLVGANLRKPELHHRFGVGNDRGLSTLLTHPDVPWTRATVDVNVPNLTLLPAGPTQAEAIDLLDGARLQQVLASIRGGCHIVLLDTPELLGLGDAIAIAKNADGVLVICEMKSTSRDDLRATASSLADAGVWIAGVILNRHKGAKPNALAAQIDRQTVADLVGYPRSEEPAMKFSVTH